jgi:hypothetical protein
MAPTPASLSLNRLIQLTVDRSERRQGIRPSLKKTLHALIAFPPQLEPSYRETHDRWNRVLERLRIENQEIVSREIEKRHAELLQMADKDDSQLVGYPPCCHEYKSLLRHTLLIDSVEKPR